MNSVEIEGGLVKDPEVGFTGSGRGWARFTLAVSDIVYNPQEKRDEVATLFISCQAWGSKAEEIMGADPHKGDKLYVRGKLDQSEYEDSEGKKQHKTRVRVVDFSFTNRLVRVGASL